MEAIREKTVAQDQQLGDLGSRTDVLAQQQQQLEKSFIEQNEQTQLQIAQAKMPVDYTPLKHALAEIKSEFDMADEDFAGEKIKSWIEQG